MGTTKEHKEKLLSDLRAALFEELPNELADKLKNKRIKWHEVLNICHSELDKLILGIMEDVQDHYIKLMKNSMTIKDFSTRLSEKAEKQLFEKEKFRPEDPLLLLVSEAKGSWFTPKVKEEIMHKLCHIGFNPYHPEFN